MNSIEEFESELQRIIEYFRSEFDLTYASAIGTLEIVKQRLILEAFNDAEEGDDAYPSL